jgi:hypothetical protein
MDHAQLVKWLLSERHYDSSHGRHRGLANRYAASVLSQKQHDSIATLSGHSSALLQFTAEFYQRHLSFLGATAAREARLFASGIRNVVGLLAQNK